MSCAEVEQKQDVKAKLAEKLLEKLNCEAHIKGVQKLIKEIACERDFLYKLCLNADDNKLNSSNINHFEGVVNFMTSRNDVNAVLEPFMLLKKKVYVDLICDNNLLWVKIIARNPTSMTLASIGNCPFGQKSIVHQAKDYLAVAFENPYFYRVPKILFHFTAGIQCNLANKLTDMGIQVTGDRLEDHFAFEDDDENEKHYSNTNKEKGMQDNVAEAFGICQVNLDVTAMIGYVSFMTNGGANCHYKDEILNKQALIERDKPLKPILDQLFEGKELICCQSAATSFQTIVDFIGGESEKSRAVELFLKMKVVPDCDKQTSLRLNKKVTPRTVTVFQTGEQQRALTVSANVGFIRSASSQGYKYTVFVHQPSALCEMKVIKSNQEVNE